MTYDAVQAALLSKRGHGASDRDLQRPFADWRRRRRYKGHFATLDLPEEMEKVLAAFAATAMGIAEARAQAAHPVFGQPERRRRVAGTDATDCPWLRKATRQPCRRQQGSA
ncbi:hypothetical protein ACFQ5C_08120 [Methylobacterium goesingense]